MANPNPEPNSRIRPGVILVVVALLGLLVAALTPGWFGKRPATVVTDAPDATDAPAPVPPPVRTATVPNPKVNQVPDPGSTPAVTASPVQPAPVPGQMLKSGEWEQRLDDILGANDDEPQKATKLLEMFSLLPEDGQIEVAQHLSNLLPDDRYGALAQSFTNAATSEGVLDVLMTDVLNRGNALKLPTLLQVARTENHPKSGEARDVLEVFVDENYGTDWPKWEKAIQDWIKANPDEPAEEPPK